MRFLAPLDDAIQVLVLVAAPVAFVVFGITLWLSTGDGPWPRLAWSLAFPGSVAFAWFCALFARRVSSQSSILAILVRVPIYASVVWITVWVYIWT